MRILITNDDGIASESLHELAKWARKLGEVTVVAPKVEQSGKSQGIDIIHPFEVEEVSFAPDIKAYSVNSTPADCVRFAILGMHEKPDLVISGINRGYNLGRDIAYSGTVGAIFEAQGLGVKALALSTNYTSNVTALEHLDDIYAYVEENKLFDHGNLWNINVPLGEVKGIKLTKQGGAYYLDEFIKMDDGRYYQKGLFVFENKDDYTLDTDAVMAGYISVTPLTLEKTDTKVYEALREKLM